MIGEGDEGIEADFFDLAAFEIEGQTRGQGRRPIAFAEVDFDAVTLLAAVLKARDERAHDGVLVAEVG